MRDLRSLTTKLWQSKYLRNIATLSGGQVLNAALPLLCAPLLGRLYTPKDYGFLGAYMSVATALSAIGNWQYSQAIIFERSERRSQIAFSVCVIATLITSLVSTFVACGFIYWNDIPERWWYALLPLTVLIGGTSAGIIAIANRHGRYKQIASVQLIPTIATLATSISLGLQQFGNMGLMLAYFTGQLISFSFLLWILAKQICWSELLVPMRKILAVSKRHRRFPIYTLPSNFISSLTLNSPVYALQSMGAVTEIGLYTRANQLLSLPMTLLGGAVAQVYQRQAAVEFKAQGNCWSVYKRTLLLLIAVATLPTIFLFIYAPQLFRIILGPEWEAAGQFARILTPMLFLRLICSPLSTTLYVVGAQRLDLLMSTATLLAIGSSVGISLASKATAPQIMISISTAYAFLYLTFTIASGYLAARTSPGIKIPESSNAI